MEDALARELRPADSLTRERPGRYWLLAPQTDGPRRAVLAERLARAVSSSASHRGTPLEVAVGIAVCPEDGRQASELAAHADVGLYAARAAGRSSRVGRVGARLSALRSARDGAAGEGGGGRDGGQAEGGVLGTAPTTRVAMWTVSSIPSAWAAAAVRSQSAPLA